MAARGPAGRASWQHLTDEDLLQVRICDLGVKIRGSEVEPRIRQLYRELDTHHLRLRPLCFLADEWLCPDGQAAIGIPFFLTHPRLKSLEFRMMFEVEGGTPTWCMRLLRHETGHAIDHAYRLDRTLEWRRVFGTPRAPYNPYYYLVDPQSKKHVRNVPENYAQCHPSEDFAETFAVWLNPASQWRTRYEDWPAMRKLRYVDRVMREIARRPVPKRKPVLQAHAPTLQSTLKNYYDRKFRLYQLGDLSFSVRDLKTIFRATRAALPRDPASAFIRQHKKLLVDSISEWSGARRAQVARVARNLAALCDQHRLVVRDEPTVSLVKVSTYVATLIVNRLRTHSYRATRP